MHNFLNFIEEDIEAKKTLINTLPTRTKTNKNKYNEKIEEILNKYTTYEKIVKKYIDSKAKTFNVKTSKKNIDNLSNCVVNLEHVRFILNPSNTYYEKLGFDSLIYQMDNYSDFQFDSLNKIINSFLDKFEMVGIKLSKNDFNYTCYVNEYMTAFLEVRNNKSTNYGKVSKIFEKIYWINPNLIDHIELNFRKLIKNNSKNFIKYITKLQRKIKTDNNIKNYDDCMLKLRQAYIELNDSEDEDITDIISLSKDGIIDINQYLPDSKVRNDIYSSLSVDSLNFDNKDLMQNFYKNIKKLKRNINEYGNYRQFIPLIEDFKKENNIKKAENIKELENKLKNQQSKINTLEKKLNKINKRVLGCSFFLKKTNLENIKKLKLYSINIAKDLYNEYSEYDKMYFKTKIFVILNDSSTISELLNLYYSFDSLKKMAIKKVFKITNYEDLISMSDTFDLFAMNPTNVIMNGVAIFGESDVATTIINKYRLSNINLTYDDINTDDMSSLLEKLNLLLRINKIDNSPTTVEKIWFMVQVNNINIETKKD